MPEKAGVMEVVLYRVAGILRREARLGAGAQSFNPCAGLPACRPSGNAGWFGIRL
jgi:hypothetical protein